MGFLGKVLKGRELAFEHQVNFYRKYFSTEKGAKVTQSAQSFFPPGWTP
jgi:hypothetical protein